MKIKQAHWHHFFGGIALLFLVVQILSGSVLTMFYSPHLSEAYASIKYIYDGFPVIAWIRDTHRWAALFLFVAVILHFIRSLLRKDFLIRESKTLWLTGVLLMIPMLGFLLTGFILPWEWRGYWFMEMVPNYVNEIPLIGPATSEFLIDVFTLNRALVTHIIILPIIALVLMEIHSLTRIKKRPGGLTLYIIEHSLLTLPFLVAVAILAYAMPMPSQDPDSIPMPLQGENIPTAEWFILIFYVPYLYFKGFMATLFGFYIPLIIFLVLAIFPYYLRGKKGKNAQKETSPDGKNTGSTAPVRRIFGNRAHAKTLGFFSVTLVALLLFGPMFAVTHASPTMGCNSCHNITAGIRMGVPPPSFKDRVKNPNLKDNTFMVEHWFYPQVVW